MIEDYKNILIVSFFLGAFLYFLLRKKDDGFNKEYLDLINSDKYKVKNPYQ